MTRVVSQLLMAPLITGLGLLPVSAPGADHVVSDALVSARLRDAAAARRADIGDLAAFLASPIDRAVNRRSIGR